MLSKIKKILRKVEIVLERILKVLFNKKTLLLALGCLLFYKIKTFPIQINSSDFWKLFELRNIVSLTNIGNRLMILNTNSNRSYICNYYVQNIENFNTSLLKKGIVFNNIYNEFHGMLENPYNQLYLCAFATGAALYENFKDLFAFSRKRLNYLPIDEADVFKDLVTNKEVMRVLKSVVNQIQRPEHYLKNAIKLTKGIMFYGPPGTGKTLIARVSLILFNFFSV